MAEETISRSRARTLRLASQAAAAVLAAVAVLLAIVGLPFWGGSSVEEVSYTELRAQAQAKAQEIRQARESEQPQEGALPTDWEAIEYSLGLVKNAPQPPEEPVAQTEPDRPDEPAAPAEQPGRTRFLGVVSIGDRQLALLSAGGPQRIVRPGDEVTLGLMPGDQGQPPRVVLHEVTPDAVRLSENGVERRVERAQRTGFSVSQGGTPGEPSAPVAREGVVTAEQAMGEVDKPINPDDFRRDDGTIDYESLREAARERARARQAVRRDRLGEEPDEN